MKTVLKIAGGVALGMSAYSAVNMLVFAPIADAEYNRQLADIDRQLEEAKARAARSPY